LAKNFEKVLISPKFFSLGQKKYQKMQNFMLISNQLKNAPTKLKAKQV
jgi:hypothetical protein